jgi:serine/threonine-protein phosphatase 2B catalytic subunit
MPPAPAKQQQLQRAIAQMTDRPVVPEIDFTQHTLEDGTSVNTRERIVKDVRRPAEFHRVRVN